MSSPPRRGRSPPSNKIGTSGGNKTPPRSAKGKTPQRTPSPSRSPPHRSRTCDTRRPRTRGSRHPREVVVERVIRETGGSRDWPQLTKTNYNEWSLLMKVKLQARHLWDVVEHGDGVRCGVFPFGDRGGVLLPPDVPILFDGGDRPRSGGDDIAAR